LHSFHPLALRPLATLLALTGTFALTASGRAQTLPPAPPAPTAPAPPVPVPPAAAAPPAAAPSAPTPPAPPLDLLPLKKALRPLSGGGLLQSRSNFQMTGSKQGLSFTFREEARIIAKRPGRFRATLTQFSADNTPQQRLLVISNGVTVWTYRPGTRQYSMTSLKEFEAANNDVTALGLAIGGFFLGDGHQLAQGFQGLTKDNSADVLTALTGLGVTLSSKMQSGNNEDDLTYRMTLTKQGLTYQFLVNSTDGALRQIELAGAQKGVQIAFKEQITQLAALTAAPKDTFMFTPPPGAAKVTTLSVDPF